MVSSQFFRDGMGPFKLITELVSVFYSLKAVNPMHLLVNRLFHRLKLLLIYIVVKMCV